MNTVDSRPFFSVVIPVYNRADRIHAVLKAVQSQSFSDFECLVVDDGSQDSAALEEQVRQLSDDRFIYIWQENSGASKARNTGFKAAKGRYIALLDSDDLFHQDKLAVAHDHLRDQTQDVMLYSRMIVNRGVAKTWIKPPRGLAENERVDEYLMCTAGWMQSSTMVLNTDLARRVQFDEKLPSSQDTDFAIRVSNAGADIIFVQEPLVTLDDVFSDTRVSKQSKHKPLLEWIERMRREDQVSEKAYWAYRGWQCARVASYSNRPLAIWLYLQSVIRGVYPPKQALVIAAQVCIPKRLYQKIATNIVKTFGKS